ncbi:MULTISPECIES: hypothetical protein [Staphylococcus]|uniref:Phage protein n=2 Tax=Staphylococcus TaxID=1279 RepID=A0ABY1H0C1_9STAP|nr:MULTISPECIES: hypothetical protein [Staphylococcus]ATH63205.1 hypothetical protein BJG87_09565 [Staphylococcus pasteuri]MCF7600845.1 hypothetical protein [Staphylococcus pasteuri]MDI3232658.1 hypothetical protein [Staphylococcus pasteuri]MDO6573014.1 hypothetical protein [Staphylococcus pasteuri_A]MEB6208121.1 hypothetical protein [Staphylococcus pasteuri]
MNKKPDKMIVDGRVYEINERHLKKMETNKLERKNVRSRIALGWNLEDAVDAALGMTRDEYNREKALANKYKAQHEQDMLTEQRRKVKARQKDMERKALLDKHRVRSKYFENLVAKNLTAKIKTDCYGRVQRG